MNKRTTNEPRTNKEKNKKTDNKMFTQCKQKENTKKISVSVMGQLKL